MIWIAQHQTTVRAATVCVLIRQVRLKDSLVSALNFYKARDAELAWIDAMLDTDTTKTDTSARDEERSK